MFPYFLTKREYANAYPIENRFLHWKGRIVFLVVKLRSIILKSFN